MAVHLLDSVKVSTSTTGTGTVTVGAADTGYLTPAEAGAVDGRVYTWRLDDGDDFEIFIGTYSSAGPTVSRDTVLYSKIGGVAGTTKLTLSGSAKLSAVPAVDYVVTPRQIREKLTANRTYYVRTDGSDSNDGLTDSAGGAFLTIQKAVDVALGTLDFNGYTVTIQVGDGTYTESTTIGSGVGISTASNLVVQGNSSSPGNVIISTTSAPCFTCDSGGICTLSDMELRTSTSGNCIIAQNGSTIQFDNIRFGSCADTHVLALNQARATASGNYSIVNSARLHARAAGGATVRISTRTVTLTGTPNFTTAFVQADRVGIIDAFSVTFSGSATGKRYDAASNGVIYTFGGGATYFPGNVSGTTGTGGQYV